MSILTDNSPDFVEFLKINLLFSILLEIIKLLIDCQFLETKKIRDFIQLTESKTCQNKEIKEKVKKTKSQSF